jgi:hypothetical protein
MAHALPEAGELVGILDRFLERAAGAAQKAGQGKLARKYKALIAQRFRDQRDWFLAHALPHLKQRVAESIRANDKYTYQFREASDDDESAAANISGLLDGWLDDAKMRDQLDNLAKLARGAGVEYVAGTMTASALKAALTAIASNAGIGYQFGLDNPRAIAWLEQHAFEDVADSIDATSQGILKNLLVDALTEKKSYTEMASEIRDQFTDWTGQRATTIATYEIGNAYTQGTLGAAEDMRDRAGIDMEKGWLTAGDDDVSDDCQENEDAGWIDLDEDFPSGDDAPLAHPNCRCALQVRTVKEEVEA